MTKEQLREQAKALQRKGDVQVVQVYTEELREATKELARASAKDIVDGLAGMGMSAIRRVNELVESDDEHVATKNSHFVINHLIGTPTHKSVSVNRTINIDLLAD